MRCGRRRRQCVDVRTERRCGILMLRWMDIKVRHAHNVND